METGTGITPDCGSIQLTPTGLRTPLIQDTTAHILVTTIWIGFHTTATLLQMLFMNSYLLKIVRLDWIRSFIYKIILILEDQYILPSI